MKEVVGRERISKIVAAIDQSQHSKLVMEKTLVIATAFKSDVYVVNVIKMPRLAAEEGDISMSEISQEENALLTIKERS